MFKTTAGAVQAVRSPRLLQLKTEETGFIIYIKPSLTGDEPADLTQYAKTHPEFPGGPESFVFAVRVSRSGSDLPNLYLTI